MLLAADSIQLSLLLKEVNVVFSSQPALWRRTVSSLCIILSVIIAPISIAGLWASNHITNTDGFVETLGPLANNQGLQDLVAEQVTTSISGKLQIEDNIMAVTGDGLLSQLLPADELANKADEVIQSSTLRIVQSESFAATWQSTLRTSHQTTDRIFNEQGTADLDQAGKLSFRFDDVFAGVTKSLGALGIAGLPAIGNFSWSLDLVQEDALPTIQKVYLLIQSVGPWAIYINGALLLAGVTLAPRYLSKACLWLTATTGLSYIALKTLVPDYIQERLLSHFTRELSRDIFDQVSHGLATGLLVTAIVSAILGVASLPLVRSWSRSQSTHGIAAQQ